jgi:hypothetical protein
MFYQSKGKGKQYQQCPFSTFMRRMHPDSRGMISMTIISVKKKNISTLKEGYNAGFQ